MRPGKTAPPSCPSRPRRGRHRSRRLRPRRGRARLRGQHEGVGGWTATPGGEDTVNVSSSNFYGNSSGDAAERFDSKGGAIFRVVTTFAEDGTPEATVNFPRGNSGDPSSPHWDDTLQDWADGVYTPFPFRREEVEAAMESSISLTPEQFPAQ